MMEEQLIDLLSGLQQTIVGIAPTAWRALVTAAFVKSLLAFPLLAVVLFIDVRIYQRGRGIWGAVDKNDLEVPFCFAMCLLAIANFIAIGDMFFATTWIGLFDPESRAILDLIDKATR
jgi:hypothetical protein